MIKKVTVSVPGCVGNMGSGFDCMGLSLKLFNRFTFERSDSFSISVSSERIESNRRNMCFRSFKKTCNILGVNVPAVSIKIDVSIPPGAGLGSSGTAIVAGIVGAFVFSGQRIEPSAVLRIGKDFEGHLDNLAASFLGGLVVVAQHNGEPIWKQFSIPSGTSAVFFVPKEPFPTRKARSVLPEKVYLSDAVFNLSRACFVPVSLREKNKELFSVALCDRLHQPYRKSLYPHFEILYKAAMNAGAAGCCISGAGPSVVAFCFEGTDELIKQWTYTVRKHNLIGSIRIIKPGGKTTWKVC